MKENKDYFDIVLNKFSISLRKALADWRAFSASSSVEEKLRLYWSSCLISEILSNVVDELGKLAAKALFNEIKTKKKENIKVVVEPKIIIRKSTRAL